VIAGKGTSYVETLLTPSKGDTIVDYRNGDDAVVSGIQAALKKAGHSEVKYAFDAVSEKGSFQNISKVLAKEGSKITLVLPGADYSAIPKWISHNTTTVGTVHKDQETQGTTTITGMDFGYAFVFLYPFSVHN
jgi:NADPH2:quinone reductase